jgi:transposase-like protein
MDGRGRALDNVFVERLWCTVKYEHVYLHEVVSEVVEIGQGMRILQAQRNRRDFANHWRIRMSKGYARSEEQAKVESSSSLMGDRLEEIAREGAQRLLAEMLEAEVDDFLQRVRYERGQAFRGYRNGHAPERTIGVGMGAVKVRQPRVSDVPREVAPKGFQSQIVSRYQRASRTTQQLLARLYLEGLSTGDFEPVFRALLGETAPLSSTSITRLKAEWQEEFESWRTRPLGEHQYLYLWVDGIYLRAGPEEEKTALLTVLGLNEEGEKELLAMVPGYRESAQSWAEVLRDLRDRGIDEPKLVIGDGALGIWAALRDVWPTARRQRCWNHRVLNVLDKLPKRLWSQVRKDLRLAATAPTRAACRERLEQMAAALREAGQGPAAETVLRDPDDFLTFYDFPEEHWLHLRTTNPIESVFAGVRLRTKVAKRIPNANNAVYLVYKIIQRLSQHWRRITGANLCGLVAAGVRFEDGQMVLPMAA